MSKYYLIAQEDTCVVSYGPFADEHIRDDRAAELARKLGAHAVPYQTTFLWLSVHADGELLVGTYLDSEILEWFGVTPNKKEL